MGLWDPVPTKPQGCRLGAAGLVVTTRAWGHGGCPAQGMAVRVGSAPCCTKQSPTALGLLWAPHKGPLGRCCHGRPRPRPRQRVAGLRPPHSSHPWVAPPPSRLKRRCPFKKGGIQPPPPSNRSLPASPRLTNRPMAGEPRPQPPLPLAGRRDKMAAPSSGGPGDGGGCSGSGAGDKMAAPISGRPGCGGSDNKMAAPRRGGRAGGAYNKMAAGALR